MKRGRPATPVALKIITGNPGKRPIPKTPTVKAKATPPKTLTADALAVWKRTVVTMPPGVFTQADENALAIYCEAVALWRLATKTIAAEGPLTTGSTGQLVASPWVKIQAEQARLILSYQQRLGFDPTSRAALNAGERDPDEDDGVE